VVTSEVDSGSGSVGVDLVEPHNDVRLCDVFDSNALARSVGGGDPGSLPGPDAAMIEEQMSNGIFPSVGELRSARRVDQISAVVTTSRLAGATNSMRSLRPSAAL
jgi:hypothetical protein